MAKATGVWTPTHCQVCGKELGREYIALTSIMGEGGLWYFLYCCVDCHYLNNKTKYEKRYYTLEQAKDILDGGV
jgi:hypothetical protein